MEETKDAIKATIEQVDPNLLVISIEMFTVGSILLEEKGQQAWHISLIVQDQNRLRGDTGKTA